MKELTLQQQYETCGGSVIGTKKGRISIPRLLQLEWKN